MTIKHIEPSQLKERLNSNERLYLIDCREEDEWDQGHIPQAKLYPLSNFSLFMEEIKDKNSEIIIHCRSGGRSMKALSNARRKGISESHKPRRWNYEMDRTRPSRIPLIKDSLLKI